MNYYKVQIHNLATGQKFFSAQH